MPLIWEERPEVRVRARAGTHRERSGDGCSSRGGNFPEPRRIRSENDDVIVIPGTANRRGQSRSVAEILRRVARKTDLTKFSGESYTMKRLSGDQRKGGVSRVGSVPEARGLPRRQILNPDPIVPVRSNRRKCNMTTVRG